MIVKATVGVEIEEEDWYDIWLSDAESGESKGMIGTARAIITYTLKVFPDRKSLWQNCRRLMETRRVCMPSLVGRSFIVRKQKYCG